MTIEADVRYLLDRLAIQDVLALYAAGQDDFQGAHFEGTAATWARVFTDDAIVDYSAGGCEPLRGATCSPGCVGAPIRPGS